MSTITTFGTVVDFDAAGYSIHDSDGTQQVVLASPMPADSFGRMTSRIWRREHYSTPEQNYDSGTWVYDSGWGDSASLVSTNYIWVRRIGELNSSEVFDSYNFADSNTVMVHVCKLEDASTETGIANLWKPVSFNLFMFQKGLGDDALAVDSNLRGKFLEWINSADSDGLTSDDEEEAVTYVATGFGSPAFTGPALRDAIDSALNSGLWNDASDSDWHENLLLNKLGGTFDTLRNANFVANLRAFSQMNIDSYPFDEYNFDHNLDSSLRRTHMGPTLRFTDPQFYLRLEDSTFDPTDIETYTY